MSAAGTPRAEKLRIRLGMRALAFTALHSGGRCRATSQDRAALRDAVRATEFQPLPPSYQILREAALACLATDPATEESLRRLNAALGVFRTKLSAPRAAPAQAPRRPARQAPTFDWQKRRDMQ